MNFLYSSKSHCFYSTFLNFFFFNFKQKKLKSKSGAVSTSTTAHHITLFNSPFLQIQNPKSLRIYLSLYLKKEEEEEEEKKWRT